MAAAASAGAAGLQLRRPAPRPPPDHPVQDSALRAGGGEHRPGVPQLPPGMLRILWLISHFNGIYSCIVSGRKNLQRSGLDSKV